VFTHVPHYTVNTPTSYLTLYRYAHVYIETLAKYKDTIYIYIVNYS
jgi:hypothetical protein